MQTFDNDARLVNLNTPAELCEKNELDDQDLVMCEEVYNEISQWVLEGNSLREIGLKAFCIWECVSHPQVPLTVLFQHLENDRAAEIASRGLRKIFSVLVTGGNLEVCGRKAIAVLSAIRPDHVGGCSLEELSAKAHCTKQNLSKHQTRFREMMRMEALDAKDRFLSKRAA